MCIPSRCLLLATQALLALVMDSPTVHAAQPAQTMEADVVIYGGTSAGIAAGIAAVRQGHTAILIEPTAYLGGLTTGGLGATDIGNKRAIGGVSREFYQHIAAYYDRPERWQRETREQYFARRPHGLASSKEDSMWTFEPHVASAVYEEMLKETKGKLRILHRERLDLKQGVILADHRIARIRMESGTLIVGRVFVDCSYEGDLMAKAGVSYHVGREANSVYDETLNGVQTARAIHHQFIKEVDPYVIKGEQKSGLLPGIEPNAGMEFSGDHKVQAYNFRMCTTDVPENRRPWEKPADYDEQLYELALRNVEAGDPRFSWAPTWMPNRKTDTNNNFAISTDFIGMSWTYPEANHQERERLIKAHESWQKGLMWTYAHHPRVPEAIRKAFQNLGLARDEFKDNDNWPRQLYVREARRMVSSYVMSERNCRRQEVVGDSVGMGAYNMDSHHVQRYVTKEGRVRNEGDVQIGSRPYPISYRSIYPKPEQCRNLLVPVCLSSSHIAYGSIRMEPVFMVLGQSAATAAALAIEMNCDVAQVPYEALKQRLLRDKQVLDFESPEAPAAASFTKEQAGGIVVDDEEAQREGFDAQGHTTAGFFGIGYRHDGDAGKGMQRATFTPDLPKAGRYQVALSYGALANRAQEVEVTVRHAGGSSSYRINQQEKPAGKFNLRVLGSFEFKAGRAGSVEISNGQTKGHVIIDAVQFLPQTATK